MITINLSFPENKPLCFNTLFKADNGKSYSLLYWPSEESVLIVKRSDVVLNNEPGEEVKVKVGRQVMTGILKLEGSIEEVQKAERGACKSIEEGSTNNTVEISTKNKKPSNRENGTSTTKKKREKEAGKILYIAPYNDTCNREACLQSVTDEDETAVPEDMDLSNGQILESSSSTTCLPLSDLLELEITVQYLEGQVELLVAKQAELVEQSKSLESRIYDLETLILSNPSAYQLTKFWRINDMADYTDLLQDVSYHSSCNLYVQRLRQTICEYFLHCRWIPLPVIENLLLLLHCQVNFRTLCCYFALH